MKIFCCLGGDGVRRHAPFLPAVSSSPSASRTFSAKSRQCFLCLCLILFSCFTGFGISQATRIRGQFNQIPQVILNAKFSPIALGERFSEKGIASWYGDDFNGLRTSNGERYNMYDLTAAHKTLPMDTRLLVKNLENGKNIVVRVNDRGPFVQDRIIDLSFKAAKSLGMVVGGLARVQIVALEQGIPADMPARDLKTGEYYVQIGTFSQQSNALYLQKRFADAGHSVVIDKYTRSHPALYRVQVYAGKSMEDARESEQLLLQYGYTDSFVVAR